ncbi:MAG: PIN domain-containing protein [Candidatus Woesearchaeota archaeon]
MRGDTYERIKQEEAERHYNRLQPFTVEITDETIQQANMFKLENKKKKLSYVDCIGYILAKQYQVKFLTGDKQFRNIENVEFVT